MSAAAPVMCSRQDRGGRIACTVRGNGGENVPAAVRPSPSATAAASERAGSAHRTARDSVTARNVSFMTLRRNAMTARRRVHMTIRCVHCPNVINVQIFVICGVLNVQIMF